VSEQIVSPVPQTVKRPGAAGPGERIPVLHQVLVVASLRADVQTRNILQVNSGRVGPRSGVAGRGEHQPVAIWRDRGIAVEGIVISEPHLLVAVQVPEKDFIITWWNHLDEYGRCINPRVIVVRSLNLPVGLSGLSAIDGAQKTTP